MLYNEIIKRDNKVNPQELLIKEYIDLFNESVINRKELIEKAIKKGVNVEYVNFNTCDSFKEIINKVKEAKIIDYVPKDEDEYLLLEDKIAILSKIIMPEYKVILSCGIGNPGNHDKGFDLMIVNPENEEDILLIDAKSHRGATNALKGFNTIQVYNSQSEIERANNSNIMRFVQILTLKNYLCGLISARYNLKGKRLLRDIAEDSKRICKDISFFL